MMLCFRVTKIFLCFLQQLCQHHLVARFCTQIPCRLIIREWVVQCVHVYMCTTLYMPSPSDVRDVSRTSTLSALAVYNIHIQYVYNWSFHSSCDVCCFCKIQNSKPGKHFGTVQWLDDTCQLLPAFLPTDIALTICSVKSNIKSLLKRVQRRSIPKYFSMCFCLEFTTC